MYRDNYIVLYAFQIHSFGKILCGLLLGLILISYTIQIVMAFSDLYTMSLLYHESKIKLQYKFSLLTIAFTI